MCWPPTHIDLLTEAAESANGRGHILGKWEESNDNDRRATAAACIERGLEETVEVVAGAVREEELA